MRGVLKKLTFLVLAFAVCGCATTYVPISWGQGDLIRKLSRDDRFLCILFDRYDPDRSTLRVSGASFDEVMMPDEVKYHLGAYRPDTKLIYRNLFQEYTEDQLRSLMLHELAHHVWFNGMKQEQRDEWRAYLWVHPSPLQAMVRSTYKPGSDFDTEDFAYTVEYARPVDIEELAVLKIITPTERDAVMALKFPKASAQLRPGPAPLRTLEAAGTSPGAARPIAQEHHEDH